MELRVETLAVSWPVDSGERFLLALRHSESPAGCPHTSRLE